jgi:hypothetical protein
MDAYRSRLGIVSEISGDRVAPRASEPFRLVALPSSPAPDQGSLMLPAVAERFALLNLMGQTSAHARRPGNADRARSGGLGLVAGQPSARRA